MSNSSPEAGLNQGQKTSGFMVLACGIFAISVVLEIISSRCLYADGAYEFISVVQHQNFVALLWSRHFACYIFEFPLVLAIKCGVTDFNWLRIFFGLGCFLPWPVVLAACHWISPRNFWLAAAGCAAGYLNAAFMAVGEHILAHGLFWPSLFVLLFARPLKPVAAVILLASATGMLFSYESQLFLCLPLAALAFWRLWLEKKQSNHWPLIIFLLATVLFIGGITVGLCGVLMPEKQTNFNGFKSGSLGMWKHMGWTLTWTVAWTALGLAAFFSKTAWKIISTRVMIYFFFAALLVWGLWPILSPYHWDSGVQTDNRVLDMLVPLALLPVALILCFRPAWMESKQPWLVLWAAALLTAQSLWQTSASIDWYRDVIWTRQILASHSGIVPLHATVLVGDGMEGRELHSDAIGGRFDWTWPSLSIALSPKPKVSCIICSEIFLMPSVREHFWQPFDPLEPKKLPDLTHYGVDYSDYISALPGASPQ